MAFWLDLFVFGFVVLTRLYGWAAWFQDPSGAERRRHHGYRFDGYTRMSAAGLHCIAGAMFSMYAAWRADLWWLWSCVATLSLVIGALILASLTICRHGRVPPPEVTPLTSEQLDRMINRRKKEALWTQAGLLAVWTYSWRHLFL